MAESKGIKCTPVAGIGYTLPLLRRREDLFVTQQEREYAILADIVSGDLYEYDKVNKLISESDIERFANSKLKWKKGWGIIGFPNHVNFITETDGKEKVMTHNHPDSNSSFSDTDVNTLLSAAQRGMIEMRAVTDYYIHIVQLPKDSEKYFSEEKEPTSIQELNRSKVTGRMNYWTKKLVSENPELTHYKSYESYEDDPILQKYLNPDLVNEKKYMGEAGPNVGTHYGMWVELHHLSVENALAEFNIPYSRVRRQTNKEFQNDIKDDKPDPEKVDDTKKEQLTEKPKPQKTFTDDKPKRVFVPKSTKKDMRYDVLPINPRDRIDLKTRRRNPYPWEDKKYFDKIKKEADTKKAELDNISNTQDVIESDNPLQKRKAKTKGTKDMVEIVKPKKFDWVPLGKREVGYGNRKNDYSKPITPLDTKKDDNDKSILDRKKLVMTLLKEAGFSKIIVAGIMGNIHKETGGSFDPMSLNKRDTNGYPSVGLIQWNGEYNGNTMNAKKVFDLVGRNIPDQINYALTKWSNFRVFETHIPEAKDADNAAYLFAKYGEVCAYCNEGPGVYYRPSKFMQSDRSRFAIDYYRRFNDSSDELYYQN